jgi:site-specific DNA recombinase
MAVATQATERSRTRTAAKRCGIYVRVSTEKQVDRESLSAQERQMLAYAEGKGWQVAKVFTDAGLSAKDTRRPALQEMLRSAKHGQLDVILVSKVDRISRNLGDLLQLIEDLRRWNVDFVCASQSFDTSTPMGKLTLNVLGSFAQFEREVTGERIRENMHERARGGKWGGGVSPFGYRLNRETKRLEPHPKEAEVVRRIFEEYRTRRSVRGTVHALNAARLFNRGGKPWALATIGRILSSPTYVGRLSYAKRRNMSYGQVLQDELDWVVVEGAHEPILDNDHFKEVQALLGRNGRGTSWTEASPHLLSGLVTCGTCGSRLSGITQTIKGRTSGRYSYYRCTGHMQKGNAFCAGVAYRADELEAAVVSEIRGMDAASLALELRRLKETALRQSDGVRERLEGLRQTFGGYSKREARLIELYEEDIIDLPLYRERRRQLEKERLALAQEITELERRLPEGGIGELDVEAVVGQFRDLHDAFDQLGLREKQRLLRAMVKRIVAHPDGRIELDLNLLAGLDVKGAQVGECRVVEVGRRDEPRTFAEQLARYRQEHGLTQKGFAALLGLDPYTVNQWELGRRRPAGPSWASAEEKTGLKLMGGGDGEAQAEN